MKGIILGAVVFAASQALVLGLCTTGRCGAAGLGPSMFFAGAVAVVATVMARRR